MEVGLGLRTDGSHPASLSLPLELLLEHPHTQPPEMVYLTTPKGKKKRLGNGRLVLHAALSLGLPACVAVAAVAPIDRLRILKQTRAALLLQQQQQQQQQQHAALQQKAAARKPPFWLGAGCGSLTCLLACGTSVTALHLLRSAAAAAAALAAAAAASLAAAAADSASGQLVEAAASDDFGVAEKAVVERQKR
ncbi:hypothetical protein Emag_001452 [Eimeria magna]